MSDETSKIRQILTSDFGLLMQIAIPLISIVFFSVGISKDVEYIKQEINTINTNHLTHIQDAVEAIEDTVSTLKAMEEKTAALLDQHLKETK